METDYRYFVERHLEACEWCALDENKGLKVEDCPAFKVELERAEYRAAMDYERFKEEMEDSH